jgi:hypothetical protein
VPVQKLVRSMFNNRLEPKDVEAPIG